MAFSMAMPWHEGEEKMHRLMKVPEQDNPTSTMLTPQAANMLQRGPLIAIGTLDSQMRPWTTLWGGEPGLSQPLAKSVIGIKTFVDRKHDPVVDILFGGNADGEVVREEGEGRMVSGLTIDLESRKRVKIFGRMMGGAVAALNDEESSEETADAPAQVQMVMRIIESLGNCPKYLNRKKIRPAKVSSSLIMEGPDLTQEAVDLVKQSDLFFVSSSQGTLDMDTNHRGGPPGFVRAHQSESGAWELYWPEYSGNRLYQTLGNFQATPQAGLVFPQFETGDVLYVTGNTEVLIGADAAQILPRSNLAVKVTITDARLVRQGLPFRGTPGEPSPYNPKVRPLTSENAILGEVAKSPKVNSATLLSKSGITPTISRYRFTLSNPGGWKAGQWVALDFSEELDIGYSHMRDDDPLSINDDFTRTFTISSPPAPRDKNSDDEFEITIRKVGPVTKFLSMQGSRSGLEVPVRGFGGDTKIEQETNGKITPFIAGGVGITPLLAQLPDLDLDRLRIFYTLHVDDTDLAVDLLDQRPEVGKCLSVFLTGTNEEKLEREKKGIDRIQKAGASLAMRRLQKEDLNVSGLSDKWHLCVSNSLQQVLAEWLVGKELVSEDFNF